MAEPSQRLWTDIYAGQTPDPYTGYAGMTPTSELDNTNQLPLDSAPIVEEIPTANEGALESTSPQPITAGDLDSYWADIQASNEANRESAMSFADEYRYEPGQIDSTSSVMGNLLDEDSAYIQRARTKAYEDAGSRGMLNSSMASGAAEGAAIDRGLAVAEADIDTQKFNVGEQAKLDEARYALAGELAGTGQAVAGSVLGQGVDFETDLGLAEQQQDFEQENLATQQANAIATLWTTSEIDINAATQAQLDAIALKGVDQANQLINDAIANGYSVAEAEAKVQADIEAALAAAGVNADTAAALAATQAEAAAEAAKTATTLAELQNTWKSQTETAEFENAMAQEAAKGKSALDIEAMAQVGVINQNLSNRMEEINASDMLEEGKEEAVAIAEEIYQMSLDSVDYYVANFDFGGTTTADMSVADTVSRKADIRSLYIDHFNKEPDDDDFWFNSGMTISEIDAAFAEYDESLLNPNNN